jgi:hypothetical protein
MLPTGAHNIRGVPRVDGKKLGDGAIRSVPVRSVFASIGASNGPAAQVRDEVFMVQSDMDSCLGTDGGTHRNH